MKIKNIIHKGLRNFVKYDDAKGLHPSTVPKIRRIISFLQDMKNAEELYSVPYWKAHILTGDRKGVWSLSINRNWRITFSIHENQIEIIDLNYEDYH